MPFKIKPIVDVSIDSGYNFDAGGDWTWLAQQDYSPSRAEAAIGSRTRGKIGGGATFAQWLAADDPKKYTQLPEPPLLTAAILQGDTNRGGGKQIGQLSLDMVDQFGTMGMATGSFLGFDRPVAGDGGRVDPGAFLVGKGIDPMGAGEVGLPSRLADYAIALPMAVLNRMRGVAPAGPDGKPASDMQYKFQEDPGYWQLLAAASTDEALRGVAMKVAERYTDPVRNGYFVQQLVEQFKRDRDVILTARSSGNERIDWLAKWESASPGGVTGLNPNITPGAVFAASIPFIGSQIAAGIAPIPDAVEQHWQGLTPEERRHFLGNAGISAAVGDFAATLPLLSGMGSALAIAKGSAGLASKFYNGYEWTLRASATIMGTGLVVATTNWALEAADPGYAAGFGAEIDYSRYVSKSSLAGVVNEIGFWSSGTFGILPALQITTRIGSKALGVVGKGLEGIHVPHPALGPAEEPYFRDVHGGAIERADFVAAGLSEKGLEVSAKVAFLSHLINHSEDLRRERVSAFVAGEDWPGRPELNHLDPAARLDWAQEELLRGLNDGPSTAEGLLRVMAYARRPRPINARGIVKEAWDVAAATAKRLGEDVAASAMRQYGPDFIASRRMLGEYNAKAMEAWVRAKTTELGGDGSKLGSRDEAGWERGVRTLHQLEYHQRNGELFAAIEAEASAEAGKLAIIRSDHLFRDQVDDFFTLAETAEPAVVAARMAAIIRETREGGAWFTNEWRPKWKSFQREAASKRPEGVPIETFRAWLEDVGPTLPTRRLNAAEGSEMAAHPINAFQTALDAEGTWALAFKPVDDAGNFVAYARTRTGTVVRSPWVEYPLHAPDNLELGNRGFLGSKLDAMFRGFRTRRLVEFQRALLFRRLTSSLDVLPEQIDQFHVGVLKLSRELHVPPQAVGALSRMPSFPLLSAVREKLDHLAQETFGPELRGRDGRLVKVDWAAEVGKSYRQSARLNLTAGLTSYLKSLGSVGGVVSLGADAIYVMWRFGLSPLFKGGEVVEGDVFNGMRGVFGRDGVSEAAYGRAGVGNDASALDTDMTLDPILQSLGNPALNGNRARQAASLSFHARHLPEDFKLQAETIATQEAAANRPFQPAFRPAEGLDPQRLIDEWGWSPVKAEAKIAAAEMVPTELLLPLREIDRRARPEPTLHGSLEELKADIDGNGIKSPLEIWWDPATNHAVIADGNHRLTIAEESGWPELPAYIEAHSTDEVGLAEQFGTIERPKADVQVPPDGILKPSAVFAAADDALDLPPLATDRQGLLEQLHATMAKEPQYRESASLHAELNDMVGENGIVPGLEVRATEILDRLAELERSAGDEGPVMRFADQSPRRQAELRQMLFDSGDLAAIDAPDVEAAYARFQRRPGEADTLGDVAGQPEAFFDNVLPAAAERAIASGIGGRARAAWETFKNPVNYKQGRQLALQIELMRKEFPGLLRAAAMDGPVEIFHKLGIREDGWADWLIEDRRLLDNWLSSKDQASFDALLEHAGSDGERAAFNELYASDEWATISGLWSANLAATRDEAFGVHFFSVYRSAFERSINHPVLGIYPASWTIKAAREWAKFLFDNRTFGELRLGMTPAQAIAQISRAQAAQFAQDHDETWQHYLEKGPLGSTIFIFNLLMPGDWSSLPFPASRTIRDILRGTTDPAKILTDNINYLGATRDVRLLTESFGEVHDAIFGSPTPKAAVNKLTGWSVRGYDGLYGTPATDASGRPIFEHAGEPRR